MTNPKAAGLIAQSWVMPGAANAMASTSKPSNAFRPKSTAMIRSWNIVNGSAAITSRGSNGASRPALDEETTGLLK